jgi:hypothetical protein
MATKLPSPAFTKFEERLLEVKRLLLLCTDENADYRIQKENVARDEALLRGAHVLLCSHLEGFFEDLIADLIEAYDVLASQVSALPERLRAWQVIGLASKWENKDPDKRWETAQQCASHPLVNAKSSKPPNCMDSSLHTDGFSNPGTGEIERLFKSVGIDDVWDQFAALEPDQIISQSVNVIVNRRNQIAHGKTDATIALGDAKIYVARAERVAAVFERLVSTELNNKLALQDCWWELENKD